MSSKILNLQFFRERKANGYRMRQSTHASNSEISFAMPCHEISLPTYHLRHFIKPNIKASTAIHASRVPA
jgi:hypothetical protein